MENSVIKLKVNSGYQIVRKTKKVDIGTAYELLNTKQQKNYTEAIIHGDYAELVWHVVRCPYCGKEMSLYEKENRRARRKILSEELVVMTGEQFSMLDNVESVIKFNEKKEPEDVYLCPKCGQFSKHSEEESEITIIHEENSINVFLLIKDMKSLLAVKWNDKITFGNAFPLYEKVSFDFENGETSISLADKEGNIICMKTVTGNIVEKEKSPLIELLQRNYALRRKVGKEFRSHTKDLSAISPDECVFERFVAFTCYRGFDEYFYDVIPYEFDFYTVDSSFKKVTSQFDNPESAMQMIKNSSLPYVKSVKRIFTNNQGLFFYIKECEKIYDVLKDVNLLCRVLLCADVYRILSNMHKYNGYIYFYKDLCKKEGKTTFCDLLISYNEQLNSCAEAYCSMSEYRKKKYLSEFEKKQNIYRRYAHEVKTDFSLPVPQMPEHIKDCVIGQYAFSSLKTKREYVTTGEKLRNCLEYWIDYSDNPIEIVLFQGEPVAAIEVEKDKVVQIRKRKNESIERKSSLFNAIKKWCRKHNLSMEHYE